MTDRFGAFDKGLWLPDEPMAENDLTSGHHVLFDGPFTFPVMVARRTALDANIATMAHYAHRHGVRFAPHGKTSMSPKLFAAQLDAGAWGITVATANQALAAWRFGVPRVFLANQLHDPRVLRWLAEKVGGGWESVFYVDSAEGVATAAEALAGTPGGRLDVVVELGRAGGRTGCRSVAGAVEVARAAADSGLTVRGVAGYEGGLENAEAVAAWLRGLAAAGDAVAEAVQVRGRPIVSAGGSAWFDVVIDVLGPLTARRDVVLRSGAYVSHDDGFYSRVTPFGRRPEEGALVGALEVWAHVQSVPEPGLAVLGAGRRDVPFDLGLPVPLEVRAADGTLRPASGMSVVRVDDQHAYAETNRVAVRPGELVRLGVSHPCTAFDKWRVIPVVDDGYRVVDVLRTYF
ncbi:alanine racemase [Yinghuangia sp. YIM S10712]|uniref:alanine racemase n=1 Tax=Yinghuangia sp. YIM S10712 TaxID=3436930 RepID=UPI003F52FE90